MSRDVLLVLPDERKVYEGVNVKVGAFHLPSLALAVLGAIARDAGHRPRVLDLTLGPAGGGEAMLEAALREAQPACVGITCTSATYHLALGIARQVRRAAPAAKVLLGGPHATSQAEKALAQGCFDYVFLGEAEVSFGQFLRGVPPEAIDGIAFPDGAGGATVRRSCGFLRNLDDFPLPDYTLYDLSRYRVSRLQARRNPVVWIETSRGCPFDCQICNKAVHGQTFRPKSVARVIAEIEHFRGLGIRELHIADDGFTSNMGRAEEICDRIVERKIDVTWSCVNGIRVDRVSERLLARMRAAGCYRISFGIESGNQRVLDNLGKRIRLEQVETAVRLAKRLGFEVFGFFIFGFSDDTERTMQDTIDFARRLPLDLAKASIMMPFPGSPLYAKYAEQGLLYPTEDFRLYNAYVPPRLVYRHPALEWDLVTAYQRKFYRSFYLNPRYAARRLASAVRTGSLFADAAAFLSMRWFQKD